MRASIADGLAKAVNLVNDNLRIYPLAKADNPPKIEFINASDKSFNTVHSNTFKFYEEVNAVIQKEPLDLLDPEPRGLFASIGIVKGKPLAPDARMKKILTDAVAIGNATARSIVWHPRTEGTMKGSEIYPGQGSDYGIAYVDSNKQPFDGSKTYKLNIPANPSVNDFWSVVLYDSQTRSQLQTSQSFPAMDSVSGTFKKNADRSIDLYFAPKAPTGLESNWLETIPGKSWFIDLRMYGPLEPWIDKTWRPSEIELVK